MAARPARLAEEMASASRDVHGGKGKRLVFRALRLGATAVGVTAITAVLLATVEGISSVVVARRSAEAEHVPQERAHTDFDPEIGWINARGVHVADLYGPGLYLQTNSQRFRNKTDFPRAVPAGKARFFCNGDSFTLGYGVKNDDTWCELLQQKDSRIETVNLGQGGYGVDQAYLWYRRAGVDVAHDVAIFAFTGVDFGRMMASTFYGYPKPLLAVADGKPVLAKECSRARFVLRGLGQRWQWLSNLRFAELRRGGLPPSADTPAMSNEKGREMATAIFEDLRSITTERGAEAVVVLLPVLEDYRPSDTDQWQAFLQDKLPALGIPFVDLVAAIRKEPAELVPLLFRGHYNEAGNRWVADRLYAALRELPRAADRLQRARSDAPPASSLLASDTLVAGKRIPLAGAHVEANANPAEAPLAMDGSVATRWQSGESQTGREEVRVDLGARVRIRQVRLELGEWRYDFGRTIAVEVGDAPDHLTEVLRASGDRCMVDNLDGSGAVQVLTLREAVDARYLRIRQLTATSENFWSVAEIAVYGDRAAD